MGCCTVAILLALSVLSLTNASLPLLPHAKELIYNYKALIRAGTIIPTSQASEFYLSGKLHLQCYEHSCFGQLSDLKYKVHNGERNYGHEHKVVEFPLPKEAEDLLMPFKIVYNSNGQVKNIVTEKHQKIYARNMHKALAANLQMDLEKVNVDSDKAHAFITDEYSIYGKTVAAYNVLPKSKDRLEVFKMHEMKSTRPMYQTMITNISPTNCEAHYEEPMSHDSHQFYIIVKQDGEHVVKHMESTGGIYIYPFQAKSEAEYVHVKVTLNLMDVIPVQKAIELTSEHVDEDLTYQMIDPSVEGMPDIMNGRRVSDNKRYVPVLEAMMGEMVRWIHEDHLKMDQPDVSHEQVVNRMVRLLTNFDEATMEEVYTTFSGKTSDDKKHLEILHQLLPLVGTHASVMLVKKIVHEKKVEDDVAMQMLHYLPSHVLVPTEKMLQDMEDMLTWGNAINVHVRKAAVLCFATLIKRTFYVQKSIAQGYHHHQQQHHDTTSHNFEHINFYVNGIHQYSYLSEDAQQFLSKHQIYDKYVDDFYIKLKSAQDYDTQLLYLQAFYNTKLPSVVKYLVPIVKGEVMNQHRIRLTAMWTIAPMILRNSDMVFELYWPIFSDWTQYLDMRILAYYMIMESHPPISRLLNVFWEMQAEPDNELYHFHYSYLQSKAHTTDPCYQVFKLNIAQIFKFTRKPNYQGYSTYHQIDYIDRQYKFGGDFSGFYISTDDTRIFNFVINSQIFNMRSNYYFFYIKIDGLRNVFESKLHLNLDSTTQLFNYDEVWNLIKSIPDMKDVKVHISVGHNHQIMQSYYYEGSNLKDLYKLFEFFHVEQYSEVKNTIQIHYDMFTKIIFPTEMGVPAIMDIFIPVVNHKHISMKKEVSNNLITMNFDNKYHIARRSRYGLSFYNPAADVWHGVTRYHSYDMVFPLYLDLTVNTQEHSVKISMKRHQDHQEDAMGVRSHTASKVFVQDDLRYGILKKSCPDCPNYGIVTKGDEYRHNYTLYEVDGYNTGYKYFGAVYDSEIKPFQGGIYRLLRQFTTIETKNYRTPMEQFLLFLCNWNSFLMLEPTPSTHGLLFKYVPSTESPVTQIDFTFHVNGEYVQQKDEYLPGMKYNTRFTWEIKDKDTAIKTWDMNAIIDVNPGHTLRNTKIDITRIIPDKKDYKVCMECTKKWTKDGVNGHMNVVIGQSTDGKCDKDGATVEVNMVGEQLEEQKTPYHVYETCQPYTQDLGADYHSLQCAAEHNSVRKYIYDVKTHNVPAELKKTFYGVLDFFRHVFRCYYNYEVEHEENITADHVKLIVEYATGVPGNEMNVEVITPHDAHEFSGLPAKDLSYLGFYPDNTHYSKLYMMMHYMGMMRTCIVNHDHVQHGLSQHKHIEAYHLPNEWTMYAGDVEKDAQHGIFLKKMEGTNMIALKTIHGPHSLEIYPEGEHGEHFKILVDGKQVSDHVDYHTEEWFSYMIRPHLHSVVLTTFHFHFHVEYKGDHVIIEMPSVHGVQFYGHCVHAA